MKIKLGILDGDQNYLNRITSVMSTRYSDKLEIYAFSSQETALSTVREMRLDVLLSGAPELDRAIVPERTGFAYLVESASLETLNGQPAICKFQRTELIYKSILSIYSEQSGNMGGFRSGDGSARLIAFQPVSGGSGSSTMAAACAAHLAGAGRRVLYLNLEKFGSPDLFFSGEGQFSMSDVIYALKSHKANLALKLESCVKRDPSGVCFFSGTQVAMDMLELNLEDKTRLIGELQSSGAYDDIVLDMDFSLDRQMFNLYRRFYALVWVSDGSAVSNAKLRRVYEALTTMESGSSEPIAPLLRLLYNRFSKSTSRVEDLGIKNIGGSPKVDGAGPAQIVKHISAYPFFDKL